MKIIITLKPEYIKNKNSESISPISSANTIFFNDGDSFQTKYDNGELKGDTGVSGINWCGDFIPGETYNKSDAVRASDGNAYYATKDNIVLSPPGDGWSLFVMQGAPGKQGIQGEQGIQGIQGIPGERGEKGEQGIQGVPGEASASVFVYDVIVRTQEEFVALYSSSTWLGATSVAFIGNGGTLKFTRSTTGLKIPSTVKYVRGFNNAIIEINDFIYNATTNKAALWYATSPNTTDYSISDLSVTTTTSTGSCYAFHSCFQLTNCTATILSSGGTSGIVAGFFSCYRLINCNANATGFIGTSGFQGCNYLINCEGSATSTGSANSSRGFYSCTQLTNCIGIGKNGNNACGFESCVKLINCEGKSTADIANTACYGMRSCTGLINCTNISSSVSGNSYAFYYCTQLTNCEGTGSSSTNTTTGYVFDSCSYLNGCKESSTLSTSGIWRSTLLFRDDDSCQLVRV